MAETVLIDELHLTVRVPAGLPDAEVTTIRTTLNSADFLARLREAISGTVRAFPDLTPCRLSVTR